MGGATGQVCAGPSSAPVQVAGVGHPWEEEQGGVSGHSGKAGEGEGKRVDTGRLAGQRGEVAGTPGWFQGVRELRLSGWPPVSCWALAE